MRKSFAVIGLGRFGSSVALTLMDAGVQVLAIDSDPECIKKISDQVTCAVNINVRDVEAIKEVGLDNIDGVVVAMGHSIEASAIAIMTAKELGVPYVLAKCDSDEMAKILLRIGADQVIYPEKEVGINTAKRLIYPSFHELFELEDHIDVVELGVRPEWIGKTVRMLNLRQEYKMNIIVIKKGNQIISDIDPDMVLDENCRFIAAIPDAEIKRMQ